MIASMSKGKEAKDKANKSRPTVFINLSEAEDAALRQFIADQPVEPDRAAVGRKALIRFLESQGYWPLAKNQED